MKQPLVEDKRQQLINKSKSGADYKGDKSKGRNRYFRRTQIKIDSGVKSYNKIDMNKFFKDDVLDVEVPVHGEVHGKDSQGNGKKQDYGVRISFVGLLDSLRKQIQRKNGVLDSGVVTRALIDCFNKNDVYTYCNCPDYQYRIGYWASVNDLIVGEKETRPSRITNPNDKLGPACKHICRVLSDSYNWIRKVSAVINNYCHYMETHYKKAYAGIIYPALYGQEMDEPGKVKPDEEIGSDKEFINISNDYGKDRGKFQKGNTQGIRFAKSTDEPIVDEDEEDL